MKFIDSLKKEFSVATWALIPLAVAINLVIGYLVGLLQLPLFLDSIGTVLVGVLCGPWAGLLTGVVSNTVGGILIDPGFFPFIPVAAVIGLVAGLLAKPGWFRVWWKTILAGVVITLALIVVAAPIKVLVYGGITPNSAGALTTILIATGQDLMTSVLSVTLLTNLADKIISTLVVFALLRALPKRTLMRFPLAEKSL